MTTEVNLINNIPLPVPERQIYRRLGHNRFLNEMTAGQRRKLAAAIALGVSRCKLRGAWRRFEITGRTAGQIEFGDRMILASCDLAALLADSKALVLFAITAGAEVVAAAADLAARGEGAGALACDAAGSEMTDAAAGWLQRYLSQRFKRNNEILTKRRFSPGYGDLALKNQVFLVKLLELEKLGIRMTADFLLIPEKTVTAVAGIESVN
ncbi:MAG: vitamin B12 dependent-methionine synthase activation domain-containing protein [Victivallaceae bacterium]|nr:vitamin B12 dependent-methionine synthase activation domain-containing protein [Victivallaceae bacterium]